MMGESKMTTNEYLAALKRLGLTQNQQGHPGRAGCHQPPAHALFEWRHVGATDLLERLLTALIKLVAASRQTLLFATSSGNL